MIGRLQVLFSHAFIRKDPRLLRLIEASSPYITWLIDSGAFSNFSENRKSLINKGKTSEPITLEEYILACQGYEKAQVWQYIALDVVRSPERSLENLKTMLAAGLHPMPVYVAGIKDNDIPFLMGATQRGFICCAGGVGSSDAYIHQRYQHLYEASHRQARIHGLGFGRFPDLLQLPLTTSDSSSWCSGARFGHYIVYHEQKGFLQATTKEIYHNTQDVKLIRDMAARCGLDLGQLNARQANRGVLGYGSSITSWSYLLFMTAIKTSKRFYFLACPNLSWFNVILALIGSSQGKDTFNHADALTIKAKLDHYCLGR